MVARNCIVCGREFLPTTPNARYCGAKCSEQGKAARRKAWEKSSGYLEKRRIQEQEKRKRLKREAEAIRETERHERRQRDALRMQQYGNTIEQAAAGGGSFARMALAAMKSGNTSPEYWAAFRDYEQEQAASFGKIAATEVNGISVTTQDFPRLVAESIKTLGIVKVIGRYERIPNK